MGQVIGAIVAETQAQAQRAANSVKVTYEDLPRILTIEVNILLYLVNTRYILVATSFLFAVLVTDLPLKELNHSILSSFLLHKQNYH